MLLTGPAFAQRQIYDRDFSTAVPQPVYTQEHPRVVVDQAHHNFQTIDGGYHPFAELLTSDGYEVVPGTAAFESSTLAGVRVLVIANARGGELPQDVPKPAFPANECDAVEQWVRDGGSLLLIADHTPFGSAAYDLAIRFGVQMGRGYVFDRQHSEPNSPTFLVFSTDNGLLGEHPVLSGRSTSERVQRVVAFTGQSLSIPSGAVALLKLAPSAFEVVDSPARVAALVASGLRDPGDISGAQSDAGRAQSVALVFGKGRVIVTGEAALFSAQVLRFDRPGMPDLRFGMNAPGNDDKQFVLNVLHWLSGALQ